MKYYAVTEDPNELLHYGRLGMKWGKHIFGDRSEGYKKAFKKLKSMTVKSISKGTTTAKAAISAVKRNAAIASENREIKRERKYQNAVAKAQRRLDLTSGLSQLNQERKYADQLNSDYKVQNKLAKAQAQAAKVQVKQAIKSARFEKHMPKAIQLAREGRLHYKNLSDEQIQKLTDRLALESQARRLGNTEAPSWHQQKKAARRKGKLAGIERGTAAVMEEVARAGAQWGIHAINRAKLRSEAKHEGQYQRIRDRARNRKTHRDIDREVKQEAYEARARSGENVFMRRIPMTTRQQALRLEALKNQQHEKERQLKISDEVANERDKEYYKLLDKNGTDDETMRRDTLKDMKRENKEIIDQWEKDHKYDSLTSEERKKLWPEYDALNQRLKDAYNVVKKATPEEQRQMILKAERAAQKRLNDDENKSAFDIYAKEEQARAQNSGNKNAPLYTYDQYQRLTGMGINPYSGNKNSNGKSNKNNKNNNGNNTNSPGTAIKPIHGTGGKHRARRAAYRGSHS